MHNIDDTSSIPDELRDIMALVEKAVIVEDEGSGSSKWNILAEEVVFMMQPQEPQILFRSSASSYIARAYS